MADRPNNHSPTDHEPAATEATGTPDFETPGVILSAARKKAGLSTADLAKELNLSQSKLQALEEDRYEKLASDVFAQGYLRRYAKLVGMDDNLVVERFNRYQAYQRGNAQQAAQAQEPSTSSRGQLPRWLLPAALFVVAVAILALVYLRTLGDAAQGPVSNREAPAQEERATPTPESGRPEQEELPRLESQAAPVPVPDDNDVQGEASASPARPAAPESEPAPEPQPEPEPTQTPAPEVAEPRDQRVPQAAETVAPDSAAEPAPLAEADEDVLSFAFSDDCWVEVTNAEGRVIHADLARAGRSLTIEGQGPFSIMLGNAQAVSLSYNGEPVSVNVRSGNRTARVRVGE